MPPFDGKAMAADVLAAVRDYVARAVAPLQAKVTGLEQEAAEVARALSDGRSAILSPGLKFEPILGKEAIEALVRDTVATVVIPKGDPGKDADPQAVAALLRPWIIEEVSNVAGAIPKPKDGEPGRDAAHLEILPTIDEAKSYPRGTYAKHANGFWRAFEQTQAMRGWECLVAGVAEVEITCAHEREFTVSHVLSDGTRFCQAFELPVAIYRGVFVDGREYHRGDQVSWGAHQWHCNEPTTEKPIEGGKAWTLAVKRGRDGKEGPAGPAGKDRIVREKA